MSDQPESVQLPIAYVGFDETRIDFANAFLVQNQEGEFTLTIAQVAPPIVLPGDDEAIAAQLTQVEFVQARVLGRYGLTRRRMVELIEALQANLDGHDRQHGAPKENAG